jgi:predicted RND superfamily exporter protein
VLPVRVREGKTRGHHAMERLAEFVIRRRRALFWGTALIVLGLTAMIPRNQLNDQFVEYFDRTIEFRRASDFASENLTGFYTIDYSLGAGEPGGISEPAFLNKVEAFAEWFRSQPGVIHVNTLTDIMKRLNKNLHGDDPAYYRIPRERELAAQYLLLYEMSLPYGLDLNNQINVDKSATRLNVTLQSLSSNQLLDMEQRASQWLKDNAPPSMQVAGSSPAVMFAHIGSRNIRSMLFGTTTALVLISLSLIVAFRSIKYGLISLIPNLVPAAMAFGIWALFVAQVGLALSVVISMTLGIVVDDTIHFLSKYLRARREKGFDAQDAIRYAFASVGTALWVTTLVLIAGFLVLATSHFELNRSMGLMTAITIALALAVDFLFLPPLLLKMKELTYAHPDTDPDAGSAAPQPARADR